MFVYTETFRMCLVISGANHLAGAYIFMISMAI